jgi:hypothetical protein
LEAAVGEATVEVVAGEVVVEAVRVGEAANSRVTRALQLPSPPGWRVVTVGSSAFIE